MKRWIARILAVVMILSWIPVQIVAAETIEIESITLDRAEIEIPEGMTVVLHETVAPEAASVSQITWTSSDPSVVRLKASGTLEAVSEGTAVVTVQAGE